MLNFQTFLSFEINMLVFCCFFFSLSLSLSFYLFLSLSPSLSLSLSLSISLSEFRSYKYSKSRYNLFHHDLLDLLALSILHESTLGRTGNLWRDYLSTAGCVSDYPHVRNAIGDAIRVVNRDRRRDLSTAGSDPPVNVCPFDDECLREMTPHASAPATSNTDRRHRQTSLGV